MAYTSACIYGIKPYSWHWSVIIWVHRLGLLRNFFCYQTVVQLHLFIICLSSSCKRKLFQLLLSYVQYLYLLAPLQQCIMLFKMFVSVALQQHGLQQIHHTCSPCSTLASSLKSSEGLYLQNTQWPVTKIIWKTTYRMGEDADWRQILGKFLSLFLLMQRYSLFVLKMKFFWKPVPNWGVSSVRNYETSQAFPPLSPNAWHLSCPDLL